MDDALLAQAKRLPPSERLELIAELWDTLDVGDLPITPEERSVLRARVADIESDPGAQESWADAQAWLDARRSR